MAMMLAYDSIMGKFHSPARIRSEIRTLTANGKVSLYITEHGVEDYNWTKMDAKLNNRESG